MNKLYEPQFFEEQISQKWKNKKFFSIHDETKKPFSILLPPPNVTGKLHIGHALDTFLQDSIIRYKKLSGYDVFYIAGTDHAGIATQARVEKEIKKLENKTKYDYGKERFIEKIWEWKNTYANEIRKQWAKLGLALDYDNERFTLDDLSNEAVNKVFIQLYNEGIIYKDLKPINWDPILQTTVSNIEVINKPTKQTMYYIKYPIANSNEFVSIATVRPETMLSDVAVVYNPSDARYLKYQNVKIIHPLTNKEIPFIADQYVDKKFGTGLMKLSAHAEVDIEIIRKHNLPIYETIDKNGLISEKNSIFFGLDREQARKEIVAFLKKHNLLIKEKETISNVGFSERSDSPIEILVLPQWFIKMEKFSKDLLKHLDSKEAVKFYPKRFIKITKQWIANAHDWNISRQLWWGHQIPAWYKDENMKVQIDSPGQGWVRDQDVLDTWFSSGIAPFSFLDWPNESQKIKRYYPTNLLVTGYDLIFFWISRMYFFGLHFMKKKPFDEVLIHGLVRDAQNRKMSKSLNNGVDPIEVIDKYGSDSLRWGLITNFTPGYDLKYTDDKIKVAWTLNNKIWNIARYIQSLQDDQVKQNSEFDEWIEQKLAQLKTNIDKAMKKYEFTIIGNSISKFIYNDFSSWYIEFLKLKPNKKFALEILRKFLIIIHPYLPFVSDYLFKEIFEQEILEQVFPNLTIKKVNQKKLSSNLLTVDQIIELISAIRRYREEKEISKKDIINYCIDFNLEVKQEQIVNILTNSKYVQNNDSLISLSFGKLYIQLSPEERIKDIERIKKEIDRINFEINRAKNILDNPNFISKAPKEKVQIEQEKLQKYKQELLKYSLELEAKCKF
ncbi:valine--tRNA ligase [Mycoplasmopsis hyopharyngis]|uniref:valine--tRNA ligase n=1 Tax=Mycoplasmopsis hyopharyngis TaxID=29558 RepID=UPI003872FB81